MQKYLTVGVLAHVDAGKTTFSEQVLYHTGAIRKLGRVDHKDAFLDSEQLEKQRGITIFSNSASFEWEGDHYDLLDTPGHADFGAEMERAIQAMDYAVLVVSCVEGIQAHTEQVWKLLQKYNVPVFFFLNKIDRAGADPERVLSQLQKRMSKGACDCTGSFAGEDWEESLIERVAEEDEALLEHYLDGGFDRAIWQSAMAKLVRERKLFPCFCGSALQDTGIDTFLRGLSALTLPVEDDGTFSATVYQIRHDARGERLAFLKVHSGVLKARDEIKLMLPDGSFTTEKANELRLCQGGKYTTVPQVQAGQLCAATGLVLVRPGDEVGARCFHRESQLTPMLGATVLLEPSVPVRTALEKLRLLEDEDPSLGVSFDEELQEIQIRVMGQIQLEVLTELCQERFGLKVRFGDCRILYRETISAPVIGYGHYEPLRHYAEVQLRLSPAPRGSGIHFASECPTDLLSQNWQNLIRTHVFEKQHRGVMTGSALCDVDITLLIGRAHLKHTEGGDFREATYRAIRQGLEQALADGKVVLLEPYYAFEITVPADQVGRLMADLQRMECSFQAPETDTEQAIVRGRGPAAGLSGYGREFLSFTRGKGVLALQFDGYEPCSHTQEVAEEIGYDRTRDLANPSCSIFCAHGAGFPVPWNEVPQYAHCKA